MGNDKLYDTSEELHIYRYENGIKLMRPERSAISRENHSRQRYIGHTIASLQHLPLCIHFSDSSTIIRKINEKTAAACGFSSPKNAAGKSLFSVSEKESAKLVVHHCNEVMMTRQAKIFDENVVRQDGISNHCLSIKFPWYDEEGGIIGVFGCTLVLGMQPLASSLSIISELGFLNSLSTSNNILANEAKGLTQREQECLFFLREGMTAKEIAKALSLSPRTIEDYLNAVKRKYHCRSRLELIKKTMSLQLQVRDLTIV